jgi:hypothetical protein
MKQIKTLFLGCLLSIVISACQNNTQSSEDAPFEYTHRIPAGENSWITYDQNLNEEQITKDGIQNWNGIEPIKTYFRTTEKGMLKLGLKIKTSSKTASIKATLNGESKKIILKDGIFNDIYLGQFETKEAGYQELILKATLGKNRETIEINEVLVAGKAAKGGVNFVKDNFHFGRRGPSVHLRYEVPIDKKVVWFYNEIEVPKGQDVVGSYFMANGFSHGYFGIQVNSEEERRILFSVWSPYDTQNPDEIPDDYRIILLKKGVDVHSGEFGNEGAGGQSYKKFMWKSNTAYRFLLKGEPTGDNHTDYTAYFFAPEKGKWELIASFRRPYTNTYLNNFYSFLENFRPSTGDISRRALYKNQWVYDTEDNWIESTRAKFTADVTASKGHRLDYAGGVEGEAFYLMNCGFFDETTPVNSIFERQASRTPPDIDFNSLE